MHKNEVLELYDHPPTWMDVMLMGFSGFMTCCLSIGLAISLFTQENHFFEIILAIIMIVGSGFIGMGFLSNAYKDRANVGGERKLRYSFYSTGLTDHTTGQKIKWEDFRAIEGNSKNGLKFIRKVPQKAFYLDQGFSEEQRKEVVDFLKVHVPDQRTWWLF